MHMEAEVFQKLLMKRALEAGFSHCEVYCQRGKSFEVLILEGEITHYENSTQRGICFRGIYAGKMGYAFSENSSEEAVNFLIREAAENAEIMEDTGEEELYGGDGIYPELTGIETSLQNLSPEEKIAAAKEMEKAALHQDNSIGAIDYCVLGSNEDEVSIANTKGLSVSYAKNCATAYVCAIAQHKNDVKTGSEYWVDNRWENFDPVDTGRKAARKAVSHLGASSVPSGVYRMLLENDVAAELLSAFCGIFYGENVEKGFSLFGGRLNEKVASSKVTLRDDALLRGATGSAPFDSEGVACQNKAVIQNGKLETFLYNLKAAKSAGTKSTGNGFKPSYQAQVKTACTNFYIQPTTKTSESLMAQLGDGLFITEISGLHAGANPISGDFSLSAEGFLVEQGIIKRPVEQITVAGNFYTLLLNIEEVGEDLRFSMPDPNGTIGSPTLLVKGISVSGS